MVGVEVVEAVLESLVMAVVVSGIVADVRNSVGSAYKWSTTISTAEYLADQVCPCCDKDETNGAVTDVADGAPRWR